MFNILKIIYESVKGQNDSFWSKAKFAVIVILLIVVLVSILMSVLFFVILYSIFFLYPYMILRGSSKVQDLQMFFINKGWVNLVDAVKHVNLGKRETRFLLSYIFSKSKSQIKYIINEKLVLELKPEIYESNSVLKLLSSYKIPTPFKEGQNFTLNFYEEDSEVKRFDLHGEKYAEYVLDIGSVFSTKRGFYNDFLSHIVSNPNNNFSLEKLGFSIEIFVPTKIKGKKIKTEKNKFSFGSVFGYR